MTDTVILAIVAAIGAALTAYWAYKIACKNKNNQGK